MILLFSTYLKENGELLWGIDYNNNCFILYYDTATSLTCQKRCEDEHG